MKPCGRLLHIHYRCGGIGSALLSRNTLVSLAHQLALDHPTSKPQLRR